MIPHSSSTGSLEYHQFSNSCKTESQEHFLHFWAWSRNKNAKNPSKIDLQKLIY